MEDSRIIELFWSRSEEAIAESSKKYENYCKSIAMRILGNAENSEECVNDPWLRAWNAIPPQQPSSLRIFFGVITRNLSLSKARNMIREKRGGGQAVLIFDELEDCVQAMQTPEKTLENIEIAKSIDRWLSGLSKEKRVAFVTRYWHCESIVSIAFTMGWSESKTSSLLRRLRLGLKEHLELEGILL